MLYEVITIDIGFDTDIVTSRDVDARAWVDRAMAELESALARRDTPNSRRLIRTHITSIGREIYAGFFPKRLKHILEARPQRIETVVILSEEPNIPWEMAYRITSYNVCYTKLLR